MTTSKQRIVKRTSTNTIEPINPSPPIVDPEETVDTSSSDVLKPNFQESIAWLLFIIMICLVLIVIMVFFNTSNYAMTEGQDVCDTVNLTFYGYDNSLDHSMITVCGKVNADGTPDLSTLQNIVRLTNTSYQ